MHDTSTRAFHEAEEEGILSRMRQLVRAALHQHGPMTSRELDHRLAGPDETRPGYHKRLSELERAGFVETVGKRPCKISGRIALVWAVRAPTAIAPAPRFTNKQLIKALRDKLRRIGDLVQNGDTWIAADDVAAILADKETP